METDTTYHLVFYKLSPAQQQKIDTVLFQFSYNKTADTILAKCFIKTLWFMGKTKTTDEITFVTKQKKYIYNNEQAFILEKFDRNLSYELKFKIPKKDFKNIFLDRKLRLQINFPPNPDVEAIIKEARGGFTIPVYDEFDVEVSKKNLKAKISKPNLMQLEKIRAWIN